MNMRLGGEENDLRWLRRGGVTKLSTPPPLLKLGQVALLHIPMSAVTEDAQGADPLLSSDSLGLRGPERAADICC